jgi:hypothetical protein
MAQFPLRMDPLGPNGLAVELEKVLGEAGLLADSVLVRREERERE